MKLYEYFLCAKKTKITTLFNNFFSSVSLSAAINEGQKALGFHQKYLNLCSEDEQVLQVWNDMRVSN